jgi:DNA primase
MSFTPRFLDELRQRLSLVQVISRKVKLTRRGREQTGLCPFHAEKSPSFTVNDDKGFFHCFGCGAHGDVIGFVMRSDGLSFPETVERLAREAGLELPVSSPEDRERTQRQATLVSAMETAAAWYEQQLKVPPGRQALDYLKQRGLSEATIARFRLGYAPEGRTALRDALAKAGVQLDLAIEAGLIGKGEDGNIFDRMRGRVIFPIADRRGRIIAFGGRILGEGQPKYLNSPETPLFHKGRTLYGLGQALRPARDAGEIVVAEGYMDVIALAQAGFAQAVAPLGTALTEEQMGELWRLVPEPTLCFDGDGAGERAAARAAERALPLLKPGQSLRFALLPAGEDPDTLIIAQGAVAMRAVLDAAQPLAEMVWRGGVQGRNFDTPERRAGLRQEVRERLSRIADRPVQEAYRADFDRRLDALFGRGKQNQGNYGQGGDAYGQKPQQGRVWSGGERKGEKRRFGPPPAMGGEAVRQAAPDQLRLQGEVILATLINHPLLVAPRIEALAHLNLPAGQLDKLRQAIIDHAAHHSELDPEGLKDHLISQGFAATLPEILRRSALNRFTLPSASLETAGEGLDHVLGLLRERAMQQEADAAARQFGEALTDEAQTRFERARDLALDGESHRRDIDGPEQGG